MKTKQFNSFPYIFGSLAFIILAIVFSTFLNKSQPTDSAADIRARASAPGMVKVTGVVNEINEVERIILVENVQFADSTKNLGSWFVTPPLNFSMQSVFAGAKLLITIDPPTMLAETKSFTAKEILVVR